MERTNLVVITSGFLPVPPTKGGAVENLLYNLVKRNEIEKKINFTIFSIYDKKAEQEAKKLEYTKIIFFKSNWLVKLCDRLICIFAKYVLRKENSQSYRFIIQRLDYLNKVSKELKKNNYDKVLLENHPTQYLALKWRKNYEKYKGRYYYHCHNEFPKKYNCENIIANTNKFIVVSNYIADYLKRYLNLKENQVEVLKNTIDIELFNKKLNDEEKNKIKKELKIDSNKKIILYAGRLVKEKGIKELLLALKNVKYENYVLLVVGGSLSGIKNKTKFENEIEKYILDLGDKVRFIGYIPYEEMYKYYGISDFAVLPSTWNEPAGLTMLEAQICDTPVITTNAGGIPEYISSKSAILLKNDDNLSKNLSKKIEELLCNDAEITKMKNNIKVKQKYENIDEYYNEFYKIMNNED